MPKSDTQFKPGQSGNPKGRPKGSGLKLTTLLKEKLELIPKGGRQSYKEMFIESLLDKALVTGDMNSYKLILNYVDGLPKQTVEQNITVKKYDWGDYEDEEIKE